MPAPVNRKRASNNSYFKGATKKRRTNQPSTAVTGTRLSKPSYSAPLKKTLKAHLIYAENFTLSIPGANQAGVKLFRANGLFAPSVSGGGGAHQPRGFDQLMALYNKYYVNKARIEVLADPTSASVNKDIISVHLQEDTTTTSDLTEMLERKLMNYQGYHDYLRTPNQKLVLESEISPYLGIPPNEDGLKGTAIANPAEQAYFAVSMADMDTSSTSKTVRVQVRIIYEATFSEPKHPTIS